MDKKVMKNFKKRTILDGYCTDIVQFAEIDWELIDLVFKLLVDHAMECKLFLRELTKLSGLDRDDVSWYISDVLTFGLEISGERKRILSIGSEHFGRRRMTYFLTDTFKKYYDERKANRTQAL